VSFTVERSASQTVLEFSLEGRSTVDVRLALRFPLGTYVDHVVVGRKRVAVESSMRSYGSAPTVGFRLASTMRLVYHHRGGIGLVPDLSPLQAGSVSRRPVIVDEMYVDGAYSLELGLPSGISSDSPATITCWHAERPQSFDGADVIETGTHHTKLVLRPPPGAATMRVRASI
jgi:hypothetical protein